MELIARMQFFYWCSLSQPRPQLYLQLYSNDPLTKCCLNGIKHLLSVKKLPEQISGVMESLLRCLCSDENDTKITQDQRKIAVNTTKKFLTEVLWVGVDPNKRQYFLDALFSIFGKENFELVEECVEIINLLNEKLYKELLRRIPNYLESINHVEYHKNLMELIYQMFKNPHPKKFPKLNVLFVVCFEAILKKIVNKNKVIAYRSIEMLGRICLLPDNYIIDSVFKLVNETGKFCELDTDSVLKALIEISKDPYTTTPGRIKHILAFTSKMLVKIDCLDEGLSAQVIYLIFKDGSPYSIKEVLKPLHELYVHLSYKVECKACIAIMRIFVRMAMHIDASASIFLNHLYKYCIEPSTINGKTYDPHLYSNLLFSEEFDYKLLIGKCVNLIQFEHVSQIIANFNHKHAGYSILLDCLLEHVEYKEYGVLTDYIIKNYEDMGFYNSTVHLLHAYNRILESSGQCFPEDLTKLRIVREKVWLSLTQQTCGIANIRSCFLLLDTLKDLIEGEDEERQRENVMSLASEMAYKAFMQRAYYDGSVLYLTEFAIALRREPPSNVMAIFENMVNNRKCLNALKTHLDLLIQLVSFLGTMALMNRSRVPLAVKLCGEAFKVDDPFVRIIAVKTYYSISTELTHEFPEIISFCFSQVCTAHTSLAKVCLTILEELISDNYIYLNEFDFMKFTHRLASINLGSFMKHLLSKRFLVSNKRYIGRFYMHTLIYMSGYTKMDNYPIEVSYKNTLITMRMTLDAPNELIQVLFTSLQVKTRFNILREMSIVFDSLVAGKFKVDNEFFIWFRYALYSFKVMSDKPYYNYDSKLYSQVCHYFDKSILKKESKSQNVIFYGEYEADLKKCTSSLLTLLNHLYYDSSLDEYLLETFDTVACWIAHIKPELIQCVQYDKCKEFDNSLSKMIVIYRALKPRLVHFINSRERL